MAHKHHRGYLNSGLGDVTSNDNNGAAGQFVPDGDAFNFTSLLNGKEQGNLPSGVGDSLGPFGLGLLGDDSLGGSLLGSPLNFDPAPAHVDFRGLITTRTTSTPNSTQTVNSSTPKPPERR